MKKVVVYVSLFLVLILTLCFAPAYWAGYNYQQQLMSQRYQPELQQQVDAFIQQSTYGQAQKNKALVKNWQGAGKNYLENNLPHTQFEPSMLFQSKDWQMRWIDTHTFAVDADLKVQVLRLQLKRRQLVKWKLEHFCILDTEELHTGCMSN